MLQLQPALPTFIQTATFENEPNWHIAYKAPICCTSKRSDVIYSGNSEKYRNSGTNTTAIRIEILTIGFQRSACLVFFFFPYLLNLVQNLSPDQMNFVTGLVAPATLALLVFCNIAGAAIDGLTAFIDDAIPPKRTENMEHSRSSSLMKL